MISHIKELQSRAMQSLVLLACVFFSCFYFSNELYSFISRPILSKLPVHTSIIATKVTSPFMIPFQLSFICALLICAPYLLYQIWGFVSPGLYPRERKNVSKLVISSSILFYLGMLFALLVICPLALKFFTSSAPNGVLIMLDIADYLDFIVTIALACGLAFQIPIVTSILIKTGIVTKQQLSSKRRHVIVIAFILGMILAPPDVFSQVLLAIPMWLLFELGLVFSK